MTLRLFYGYFPYDYYEYIHIIMDIMQRLSAGKGYDYFSRNAATIVRPYWLSGDSPKRDAAVAANGSAPPAALLPLDCPAGWRAADCKPPGWHGLPSYIPYYNRRPVLTCAASRRGGGIWYLLSASGRVCALQRGAGGIIAAFVGLVSVAVEWGKSQEKPLQSSVRCFVAWAV